MVEAAQAHKEATNEAEAGCLKIFDGGYFAVNDI